MADKEIQELNKRMDKAVTDFNKLCRSLPMQSGSGGKRLITYLKTARDILRWVDE